MSETQQLLGKIVALRQQLEQAQGSAEDAVAAVASLVPESSEKAGRIWRLERQVANGLEYDRLLHGSLRQLSDGSVVGDQSTLPRQLTARARRLLNRGRDVLTQLRDLPDHTLLEMPDKGPLAAHYRETVAMADTALRMVQAFPDAPSAQLRLCEGLEAILEVVAERSAAIAAVLEQRGREMRQVDTLAELLAALFSGKLTDLSIQPLVGLAEFLLEEAHQGAPLRFLDAAPAEPARFIAAHSFTVAQVVARVIRHDPDFGKQPVEPLLAALLHDVGMLAVPASILAHPGTLDDAQCRVVEGHVRIGAELAARLLPSGAWLQEAVAGHHERLDGTGYPAGLRELQINPLARLLAVCDVYAAQCSPRPHRPAQDSRTALTDTLLLAEQGALDRAHAERLLQLSFYPVGSIVELSDGATGVVVATHSGRRDLSAPARPVVLLLTDVGGVPLPVPLHLDLAQCESRSIVRAVPHADRRQVLGKRFLPWT